MCLGFLGGEYRNRPCMYSLISMVFQSFWSFIFYINIKLNYDLILGDDFSCPICGEKFVGLNRLNLHVDKCLSQSKSYI